MSCKIKKCSGFCLKFIHYPVNVEQSSLCGLWFIQGKTISVKNEHAEHTCKHRHYTACCDVSIHVFSCLILRGDFLDFTLVQINWKGLNSNVTENL